MRPEFDVSSGEPVLMNAAGTAKNVDQARALLRTPIPAVMLGSYTLEERSGNDGTTYYGQPQASLNSLGLPSPRLTEWAAWVNQAAREATDSGKKTFVSVAGFGPREFKPMVEAAFEAGAYAVELNLGCPNIWDEGTQKRIFSYDPDQIADVLTSVSSIGALPGPLGVKLSPLFDSVLLSQIDELIASAPIDFLSTTNTVPNCFAYSAPHKPAISFGSGLAGMSGPAIRWVGLGQVAMHRDQMDDIFIFGIGGITAGSDVVEYIDRGADACQIGTAIWDGGSSVVERILQSYLDVDTAGGS